MADIAYLSGRLDTLALALGVDWRMLDGEGRPAEDAPKAPESPLCAAIQTSPEGLSRCRASHTAAWATARSAGTPCPFVCHAGLTMLSAAFPYGGNRTGCVLLMPFLGRGAENAWQKVLQELGLDAKPSEALSAPRLSRDREQAVLQLLHQAVSPDGYEDVLRQALMDPARASSEESVQSARAHDYPLHLEREMLGRIRLGDKNGARAMLNQLLSHIFLRSSDNMELTKARLMELIVMISRAAVESGAEMEKLLGLNYSFLTGLSEIDDFEELTHWVVQVLDAFLETVYASRSANTSRQLADALTYIRQHHAENLSLEDVAGRVFVSPYYLSHMFKEKLGVTFVEYVTRVRIENAKNHLLNTTLPVSTIAEMVGYEDASYFGKVFKRLTGTTPKRFRKG